MAVSILGEGEAPAEPHPWLAAESTFAAQRELRPTAVNILACSKLDCTAGLWC